MKGKIIALLLALLLAFALPLAFAADSRIEEIEYKGFGILKLDFNRGCDWFASAEIALTDDSGTEVPYTFIGGEDEECYLRAETLQDGASVNLAFRLGETVQNLRFNAETGVNYRVKGDDVSARSDNERCDFCRESGHDEEYCPGRIDPATLSGDPDALARIFDIDRCDFCRGMGHDDDRCPER